MATKTLGRIGEGWAHSASFPWSPVAVAPYGLRICTVTGFFGDSIRFRTNESVVNELLLLKPAPKKNAARSPSLHRRQFRLNIKRTKSLLRDIIAPTRKSIGSRRSAPIFCATKNLSTSSHNPAGKWVFIGMESIDPANLARRQQRF